MPAPSCTPLCHKNTISGKGGTKLHAGGAGRDTARQLRSWAPCPGAPSITLPWCTVHQAATTDGVFVKCSFQPLLPCNTLPCFYMSPEVPETTWSTCSFGGGKWLRQGGDKVPVKAPILSSRHLFKTHAMPVQLPLLLICPHPQQRFLPLALHCAGHEPALPALLPRLPRPYAAGLHSPPLSTLFSGFPARLPAVSPRCACMSLYACGCACACAHVRACACVQTSKCGPYVMHTMLLHLPS